MTTLEEDKRFLCLAALLCRFANGARCQDIDQVLFHGDHLFLSTFSSSFFLVLGKNASIRSKLPTAVCWSREKREEGVKSTWFMSKATSVPQANHPSPVDALNLIVESKSLPAEVNDLNIELHLPVKAKKKLAIVLFCGF